MKFLRNNECKRHASSHTGFKPFVCDLCPPERYRAFVRQDLLKRHLKVTHRMNGPTRKPRGRKRKLADSDDEENYVPGSSAV